MFYVVHGYCGPDHCTSDNGPILKVTSFKTAGEVEAFHKELLESFTSVEYSGQTFRVFEGRELFLKPIMRVVEFKLER